MTIREGIMGSLKKRKPKDVDGMLLPSLPIMVPYLARAFALLLYLDSCQRNSIEPDEDIVNTLSNSFTMKSLTQDAQLMAFLEWWVEQEATMNTGWNDETEVFEDDKYDCWYEAKSIIQSWNKFAVEEWAKGADCG